jgi:pyruvate/2-oxoglutarate dehydrogenase complex dihydrolipoamide dehydrogenase (E3) component
LPQQVDYDLVIIGSTHAALKAALAAARQKLRLALVLEQPLATQVTWYEQALRQQIACQQVQWCTGAEPTSTLAELQDYATQLTAQQVEIYAPAALGMNGVDVVVATEGGEFYQRPRQGLGFTVSNRQLRARAYLLAASRSASSAQPLPVLTPETVTQDCTILGNNPKACEIAHLWQHLGAQVSLNLGADTLLPREDPVIRTQVAAQLEAVGIHLCDQETPLNSAQVIDCRPAPLMPNRWNLATVGVEVTPTGIPVNHHLQTSHPQIYACGELLAGYDRPELAQAEALWFVRQLSGPWFHWYRPGLNYQTLPWTIHLNPPLTQVGWSESQARQKGMPVQVHDYRLTPNLDPSWRGDGTGFCRILTTPSGQLLGAAISGEQSLHIGQWIALALRQRLKLHNLVEGLGIERLN